MSPPPLVNPREVEWEPDRMEHRMRNYVPAVQDPWERRRRPVPETIPFYPFGYGALFPGESWSALGAGSTLGRNGQSNGSSEARSPFIDGPWSRQERPVSSLFMDEDPPGTDFTSGLNNQSHAPFEFRSTLVDGPWSRQERSVSPPFMDEDPTGTDSAPGLDYERNGQIPVPQSEAFTPTPADTPVGLGGDTPMLDLSAYTPIHSPPNPFASRQTSTPRPGPSSDAPTFGLRPNGPRGRDTTMSGIDGSASTPTPTVEDLLGRRPSTMSQRAFTLRPPPTRPAGNGDRGSSASGNEGHVSARAGPMVQDVPVTPPPPTTRPNGNGDEESWALEHDLIESPRARRRLQDLNLPIHPDLLLVGNRSAQGQGSSASGYDGYRPGHSNFGAHDGRPIPGLREGSINPTLRMTRASRRARDLGYGSAQDFLSQDFLSQYFAGHHGDAENT